MVFRVLVLIAALAGLAGCGGPLFLVNIVAVDEQTALERQVLGTYEDLGRDLTVYASMRGVQPDGSLSEAPERTDSQAAVMQAFNNRRYNRDDLNTLLTAGAVGEARNGMVVWRDQDAVSETGIGAELAEEIVGEENADRATILARLIETTPGVSANQQEQVAEIFANLNQQLAPPSSYIQTEDGEWRQK